MTYAASANDDVDGPIAPSCAPTSESTFPLGVTTVACSAKDQAGNEAKGSFTVTVRDTTAPTISGMPADLTAEATSATGAAASWTAPTATDLVDGPRPVTCSPASGSTFPVGTATVTCSAGDTRGNADSKGFTVTVTARDTSAPKLALPVDQTAEATGKRTGRRWPTTPRPWMMRTPRSLRPAHLRPGGSFPLGVTTVGCSAKDKAGNEATGSFAITVRDTRPPTISGIPSDLTVEATSATGATASWTAPTATDLVDGPRPVTCSTGLGEHLPTGYGHRDLLGKRYAGQRRQQEPQGHRAG